MTKWQVRDRQLYRLDPEPESPTARVDKLFMTILAWLIPFGVAWLVAVLIQWGAERIR